MTVAELIAHLQQLPQDMQVVISQDEHDGSYGGPCNTCAIDIEAGLQLVRLGKPVLWYTDGKEYEAIASDAVEWLSRNGWSNNDGLAILL